MKTNIKNLLLFAFTIIFRKVKKMDLDINLNEISHEDVIMLYGKIQEFVKYLDNEVENSEVEKIAK